MRPSKCVVFDLDDTLFLERDYVYSGFCAVGSWAEAELGISGLAESAWSAFERGVRGSTFQEALTERGIEPRAELVAQLVTVYRSHAPRIKMLEDACVCIEALQPRTLLAVVTDGPKESQHAKAVAMATHQWANPVVLTADLGSGASKPSPKAFIEVQVATGASGDDCVYVADNPLKDFTGPRSCGWRTVRVRRSGSLHVAVPSGPDVDVDVTELTVLPTLLDDWLTQGLF